MITGYTVISGAFSLDLFSRQIQMANIVTRSTSEKSDELMQVISCLKENFNLHMDEVTHCIESLERRSQSSNITTPHNHIVTGKPQCHILKLDVPRFMALILMGGFSKSLSSYFITKHQRKNALSSPPFTLMVRL